MRISSHVLPAATLIALLAAAPLHAEPAAPASAAGAAAPAKGAAPAETENADRDPDPKHQPGASAERRNLLLAIIAYGAQFSRR